MILWVALVAVLALRGLQFSCRSFHKDYLSKDATQPVKGIFILFVFVSHFSQNITAAGPLDTVYSLFRKALGQLVVALFLFYSGYGVTVSFMRGGTAYLKRFPLHRLGKLHLQMVFAILLFWGANLILGRHPGVPQVLLSTVGLDSIGNSAWYILAIFLCYLASFVSFLLCRKRPYLAAATITALSCACVLVLRQGREAYFYNTFLCYAAGVWFALFKERVDAFLQSGNARYLLTLAVSLVLLAALRVFMGKHLLIYEATAVIFALTVILLTMKFRVTNRVLAYAGEHLFSLFILQHIPMMLLKQTAVYRTEWLYFVLCLIMTAALSWAFDEFFGRLWKALLSRKEN